MRPRLSIVVPFYCVEAEIRACLASIERQTFTDFEVVLVDDGSTDGSTEIAREFVDRDPRFNLVAQVNQGLGPARNTGVKHSVGEFITFVDSDDLVPRHAYEIMVESLDHTGSSFAAGDARRFNSSGVRESWSHRIPFAKRRRATHVTEFPDLTLDRMVWNKVYRRSFWEEFGYEFPPIRYEDYPITLRAHFEAVTVDVLPAPVYYWRERESGESITQQAYELSNVRDRVTSAEMVMELVARWAPPLRNRVHRLLADIDLGALLQAFATVSTVDEAALIALGRRFVNGLDASVLDQGRRFDRLQIHALREGDVAFLRELAEFRHTGGLRGGARARRRRLVPWQYESEYPGLDDRPRRAPRELYRLPAEELTLHTSVTDIGWRGSDLTIRGTAEVRHLPTTSRSSLRLTLVGDGFELPCAVVRSPARDSHGDEKLVGFEARIDAATLASLPVTEQAASLRVEVRNRRSRRHGELRGLRPGSPGYAEGRWVRDGVWLQPCQGLGGALVLKLVENPAQVTGVSIDDSTFLISGVLPGGADAHLSLSRSSSGEVRTVGLDQELDGSERVFTCRITPADFAEYSESDGVLGTHSTWELRLVEGDGRQVIIPTGLRNAVGVVCNSQLVTLTRTPANRTVLHVSPVAAVADLAELTGRMLAVGGRVWNAEPVASAFVWRRFLVDSDEPIEVTAEASATAERWSLATALDDLVARSERPDRSGHPTTASLWTLFAVVGEGPRSVRVEEFLSSRLPLEVAHDGRTVTVTPRAGLLRVVVR